MQAPEDQVEQYTKGQHLRGADAQHAEQLQAEMVCALSLRTCNMGSDSSHTRTHTDKIK